jgi:hypothetical protein
MGHISTQMRGIETELRRIAESMDQISRVSRPLRAEQPGTPAEAKPPTPSAHFRLAGGLPQAPDSGATPTPAPTRTPTGGWRASELLPKRFNGPMMTPGHPSAEQSKPWQVLPGSEESTTNTPE